MKATVKLSPSEVEACIRKYMVHDKNASVGDIRFKIENQFAGYTVFKGAPAFAGAEVDVEIP